MRVFLSKPMHTVNNKETDPVITCLFLLLIALAIMAFVCIFASFTHNKPNIKDDLLIYLSRTEDNHANTYIYYDKDTKVMYMINYHGGITVMVNPDGTPKLYEDGDSKEQNRAASAYVDALYKLSEEKCK